MRLNIGCGATYAEGWVNVDISPEVTADVHADATALPLGDNQAEMIYLGHMLEHVPLDQVGQVLKEAWRLLEPGGFICVVGPDLDKVDRTHDPELWDGLAYGGHNGRTDQWTWHKWGCTARRLYSLVSDVFPDAVLVNVTDLAGEWPISSRIWYQAAVMARKRL